MSWGVAFLSLLNNEWALRPLSNGMSSVEWTKKRLLELSFDKLGQFLSENESDPLYSKVSSESIRVESLRVKKELYPFLNSCLDFFKGIESILFVYGDAPLNDPQLLRRLYEQHSQEWADYSFTEQYPQGIGGEILSYRTLKKVKDLASTQDEVFQRDSLSRLLHRDIHQYDVERLISEHDFRPERLRLISDSPRNFQVLKKALEFSTHSVSSVPSVEELVELTVKNPEFMRSVPAFVEMEITNHCNCVCIICPRTHLMKRPMRHMKIEEYEKILQELKNLCGDLILSWGYMGEPTLHPDFFTLLQKTLEIEEFQLLIESNGIFWENTFYEQFLDCLKTLGLENSDRLTVILALDSSDRKNYSKLRSVDELSRVEENAFQLLQKRPKQTYIQILRLKENDEELDSYHKKWSAYPKQILLQKYNSYRGELMDRKAVDLAPLNRFPCWHLKRDLCILSNGTVPFCKQDIDGKKSVGNAFTESIHTLWKRLEIPFIRDHQGNIDPFCKNCDEWFTYNF